MLKFESDEYWQLTTWDRFLEINRVPTRVRMEFLRQEELTIKAIYDIITITSDDSLPLKLLDFGCGTGRISKLLLDQFKQKIHVTLLDFNKGTLEFARKNLTGFDNVTFIGTDFYHAPSIIYPSIDVVICMDIIHHVKDIPNFLDVICKLLVESGCLVGNVFATDKYHEWDTIKYGNLFSYRRRLLNLLACSFYSVSPPRIKKIIRRIGIGRIAPVDTDYMQDLLSKRFNKIETNKNYYLWFKACKLL